VRKSHQHFNVIEVGSSRVYIQGAGSWRELCKQVVNGTGGAGSGHARRMPRQMSVVRMIGRNARVAQVASFGRGQVL
jgi:hypothetical protein